MTTLLVSDLHLDASRPAITRLFLDFLAGEARQADALYVLGDLFEAWVGDDDPGEPGASVCAALKALADSGVPVFLMRGNRDFLFGPGIAARCGATLLPDPCVVDLHGRPTLLMHGDLLCTDDVGYQPFRRQVRDPAWQATFLAQPLEARQAFAAQGARRQPRARSLGLAETISRREPRHRGRGDVAPRRRPPDPRPHPSPGRSTRSRSTAARPRASCWATGTSRARCCGWTPTAWRWPRLQSVLEVAARHEAAHLEFEHRHQVARARQLDAHARGVASSPPGSGRGPR